MAFWLLLRVKTIFMRILIIEDEPKTIQSLRQGLEELHWSVQTALDGNTGLALAQQEQFDVIVSDIIMPGLSGLDICRQLRHQNILTPLLLMSALSETDDKIIGLEAGADDYLAKPISLDQVLLHEPRDHRKRPLGFVPEAPFATGPARDFTSGHELLAPTFEVTENLTFV